MAAELSPFSEEDDSSTDAPPPPPPPQADDPDEEAREEERYQEQLKVFKEMAEFSAAKDEINETMDDDGSVEVPPPDNYEKMGEPMDKGATSNYGMVAGCLLLILAVILGVGFGTGAFTGSDNSASTTQGGTTSPGGSVSTPAPDARGVRLRTYLESKGVNGDATFSNPTSPEAQALQWLQDEDPLELDPLDFEDNYRIDQRYALLTLWFNSQSDWFNQTNWLSDDECTWLGVTCGEPSSETRRLRKLQDNSTVVTRLEVEGNNLQGTIPVDLSLLSNLQILNLGSNAIGGPIPSTITNLAGLTTLVLFDNALTGDLTTLDFAKLAELQILDVSVNSLQGSIPDSLWSMPSLVVLVLDDNGFSGQISTSIANLQSLRK